MIAPVWFKPWHRLLRRFGLDRTVAAGVAARAWEVVSGLLTLALIAKYFSLELQGYYFTLGSLLMMKIFVELSLGRVILHTASYEWSKLTLNADGRLEGDANALSRLVSLGRASFLWYGVGGAVFAVTVGAAGYWFLGQTNTPGIRWQEPWLALVALTGIALPLLAPVSLLSGCGQISRVYMYRFVRGLVVAPATWIAIAIGAGLWTIVVAAASGVFVDFVFVFGRYRRFFSPFFTASRGSSLNWWLDVWPLQWRLAIVSVASYFMSGLFTPLLFYFHGPVLAGQMGLTWRLLTTLRYLQVIWLDAKSPQMGVLVARREYAKLDRLTIGTGTGAVIVTTVGSTAVLGLTLALSAMHHPWAERLLPPLPTALMLAATILFVVHYAQQTYARAHRSEPFVTLWVVQAIAVSIAATIFGKSYGATGVAASYLAIIAFVLIPWSTVVWYRCRNVWHVLPAEDTGSPLRVPRAELAATDRLKAAYEADLR